MDGGTIRNVNTLSAIEQCLEIVDDESKITIDVLACGDPNEAEVLAELPGNTIGWWLRAPGLDDAYSGGNIYRQDVVAHPKVNWRYLAWQSLNHAGGVSQLNFEGDATWPLQVQGRADAQTLLAAGEGKNFELLARYNEEKELKAKYPTFSAFLSTLQ